MKEQITNILLVICILVIIFIGIYGIKIGDFEILSIKQFIDKDKNLNEKISQASYLTSNKYPESQRELEETYEKLKIQKQKYEQKSGTNSKDGKEVYESKKYDIVYLWKTIGKHATKQNLELGMKVEKTNIQDFYNLNFTVIGQYNNTIKFISDIENDSDLNFRIYNFKMTGESIRGGAPEDVTSVFEVRNINVDPETIIDDELNITLDDANNTKN